MQTHRRVVNEAPESPCRGRAVDVERALFTLADARRSDEARTLLAGPEGWENMMIARELLEEALKLKPEDRFVLVEVLLKSLDEPDRILDDVWVEEAEKRLRAYREGRLDGVPMEDLFGKA